MGFVDFSGREDRSWMVEVIPSKSESPHAVLPQDDATRKAAPMYRGLLGYFPAALFRVAAHSYAADRKHNGDRSIEESPTWAREKSRDHLDCIVRHLAEMHVDPDYHLAAIAWRALAALQEHEEAKGAVVGARSR